MCFATAECRWTKRLTLVISLMKHNQNKNTDCTLMVCNHNTHVRVWSIAKTLQPTIMSNKQLCVVRYLACSVMSLTVCANSKYLDGWHGCDKIKIELHPMRATGFQQWKKKKSILCHHPKNSTHLTNLARSLCSKHTHCPKSRCTSPKLFAMKIQTMTLLQICALLSSNKFRTLGVWKGNTFHLPLAQFQILSHTINGCRKRA